MRGRRIGSALAALTLAGTLITTVAATTPAQAADSTPIKGDYATPIQFTDGNHDIDVSTTIAKLSAAHVNTYAYLICYGLRGGQDWNTLPSFLGAAAAANINVWVYLCPPTESKDAAGNQMPPYALDYVQWATAIANLSLTYANLTGYAIDDFAGNGSTFTRAYTQQMVDAARAVNPAIKFRPVLYYTNLVGYTNILGAYRYYIDGVIFPYRNESGGTDTTNFANADPETRAVSAAISCDSGTRCAQFYFPPDTPSQAGWSTSYSQTVTVNPTAATYGLSLDVWDDFTGSTSGYRYARVLIDGTVVWSRDIAGTPASTHITLTDPALRATLAGKTSAKLSVQMYDAKAVANFHSAVTFDSLTATGFTLQNGGFDGATGWTPTRSSTSYLYGTVANMKPTVMAYASKLHSEPAAPSASYVGAVISTALNLAGQGIAEGAITYCLNKTGADTYDSTGTLSSYAATYDTIASIYAAN